MFINHTHKFIFIHIPKNGGTSIRNSFDINGYDKRVVRKPYPHDTSTEIREYCGEEVWNTFYKFAVVRNPYDRLVSFYHFHKSNQYTEPYGRERAFKYNFKDWVINIAKQEKRTEYAVQRSGGRIVGNTQFSYLSMQPNKIIRFENLQEDFNEVCSDIGIEPYELPHYNKSEHEPFESYYDDELKEIVYGMFIVDFKRFRYAR